MRRLTFVITLIITAFYSFAQWELQNPIPTDANLNDIFYIDDDNGWAVGEHGTIISTYDGGQNWEFQLNISSPPRSIFTAVYFTDLLNGWAVGYSYVNPESERSSMIYHTDDGGSTWENQYSDSNESFNDVWFVNPDTGWVVGAESDFDDGVILYTENGGINWEEQYRVNFKYLSGICFTDSENGCAVGAQGHIVNTSNGGETWEVRTSYTSLYFTSVCFTDWNNGWAIGEMPGWPAHAKILHTQDGGNSWEVKYEFGDYEAFDVDAIFFVDANNGWVTLYGDYGTWRFLKTTDGGATWHSLHPGLALYNLPSIHFIDPLKGWAVGNNVIIHTTDGGQNWLPQNTITNIDFNSICLVDDSNAWAAGSKYAGSYSYYNSLVHTNDAGITWVELGWEGGNFKIMDMYFIDKNHGWSVSSSGVHEWGKIYRTVDGGLNWEYTDIGMELSSVYFIDSLNGWVVGPYGTILHTINGGIDWVDESTILDFSLIFNDVFFTDLSHGWIIGTYNDEGISYGKIYYTNNGGSLWEEQHSIINTHLIKGCFADFDKVWVIGGSIILHTSDGGANWQQQTSGVLQLSSIYFTDADNGWAVGRSGTIISSNDGGETWEEQASESYNNLNSIQMINSQMGWAVGNNGAILYTSNGGTVGFEDISNRNPNPNLYIQSYPNPFSSSTTISYNLHQPSTVQISIFSHLGKQIDFIQQNQPQGKQQITWDASGQPPGMFYFQMQAGEQVATGKLQLVR